MLTFLEKREEKIEGRTVQGIWEACGEEGQGATDGQQL